MKKNRNGFTLIELLAVIVILAIIGVIGGRTISEVMESSAISAFKTSNDALIREIKNRIEKNNLYGWETIACSNYGENSCTDVYDLSKEDYALSITDLGNDNYDVILIGKGVFDGIDIDGNGNCIIYTNINKGKVISRNLEKRYSDLIMETVILEEQLPKIVKDIYSKVAQLKNETESTDNFYQELNLDNVTADSKCYFRDTLKEELEKKFGKPFGIGGENGSISIGCVNKPTTSYSQFVKITFYSHESLYYNGEPIFDSNYINIYAKTAGKLTLTFFIKNDEHGTIEQDYKNSGTEAINEWRYGKYALRGYKNTVINIAKAYFNYQKYNDDNIKNGINVSFNTIIEVLEELSKNEENKNLNFEQYTYLAKNYGCGENDFIKYGGTVEKLTFDLSEMKCLSGGN